MFGNVQSSPDLRLELGEAVVAVCGVRVLSLVDRTGERKRVSTAALQPPTEQTEKEEISLLPFLVASSNSSFYSVWSLSH